MAFTAVVGYNESPGARAALDVALGLVERLRGRLIIACLFDAPPDPMICDELRAEGERIAKGALMAAGNRRIRAESVVANRPIAEGLLEIAEKRCADMLFVGTRGESLLLGAILGSTCHKLVHCTTVPLVVVPPAAGIVQA